MDWDSMTSEEITELVEAGRRVLAVRQTGAAIARDITRAVDPIVAGNLDLLGDAWEHGRVSWDGEVLTIGAREDYDDIDVPAPDPDPGPEVADWEPGVAVQAGDHLRFEGEVYRVVQAHTTASHWRPDQLPSLYAREG